LTIGPFAGNLLAVDQANNKVVRAAPPFGTAQAGIDFITNLTGPVGLAVNQAGNLFVSNTDGTILQFEPDGTPLGLFANTGLHNMNIAFSGAYMFVATQDGPVIMILPNGTQENVGTVVGGDGIAVCKP
jgi:sugar lactone lactonase YvrE